MMHSFNISSLKKERESPKIGYHFKKEDKMMGQKMKSVIVPKLCVS